MAEESTSMYRYVLTYRPLLLRALVVLLAAVAMVVVATRTGKWVVVERLASRIAESDDRTAARLVEELAAFDNTAYPALVQASTSSRSAVALTARHEIDKLVEAWMRQSYLHPSTFELRPGALPLAVALESHLPSMSASGQRWARGVLVDLLTLAQEQRLADRLPYLAVCDRALAKLPVHESAPLFEADAQYQLTLAPPQPKPVATEFAPEPRTIDFAPPTLQPPTAEGDKVVASTPAPGEVPPMSLDELPATPDAWNPEWSGAQFDEQRNTLRVPAHAASTQRRAEELQRLEDEQEPGDRKWFVKLATGDEVAQAAAAKELKRLGYGLVTPLDARIIISASSADRLAMVNNVLTSPRLDPSAWLWQLARDPAGEVRAAAIGALSTTANRKTIAELLELVIRDTDPRVAEQAETLRSKLK